MTRRRRRVGLTACIAAGLLAANGMTNGGWVQAEPLAPSAAALLPARVVAPNTLSATAALALVRSEQDKYWLEAKTITARSVPDLYAQQQDELRRGLRYSTLLQGDPQGREIALTFDDGPHTPYTSELLAILKQYHVRATFFVVGEQAEKHPELIQAELAAGHDVGNHTYDHVSLVKIPQDYVGTEIKACGEVLDSITSKRPHLFRPPGGVYDPMVAETAEMLGYTTVLWTDDPGDYASPGADVILSRTLEKAGPGGIILLHDGIAQTVQMLPQLIQTLKQCGYKFVTVDQMLAERASRRPASALLAAR